MSSPTEYDLCFHPKALKEWKNLTKSVQERLLKKLAERLQQPHIETSRLRGALNRYKIKIGTPAFRLVYEVEGRQLKVLAIAKKGDKDSPYQKANERS
ncbi:MAG TPA: type II toxin-antitoxin system mRNA interferase toxin, RelE/StbE family [Synechococcus sp. UBA8638]|nr:type II toxin-antitoxin system mRNA interferase toxin, RelE/StbE family [Synechococcus sp. UBA8638]